MTELTPEQRANLERLLQAVSVVPPQDTTTGAPVPVRLAVGAAQTPEDRLATLRRFAPDAQPYERDNFVYTDPRTGRRTLYNERNPRLLGMPIPTLGDIASLTPEAGEMVGGVVGGALAAPAAVAGAVPTGGASMLALPAGVGLGAGAGREIATTLANRFGSTVDTRGPLQRFGDAATTVGVNAAAGPALDALAAGVRGVAGPVARSFGGETGAPVLQEFARLGVEPSAGAVTGNRTMQLLEKGLEATPGGVQPIRDLAERQAGQLGQAARETAEAFGMPTNPGQVGHVLREGAQGAVRRFEERQGQLYDTAFSRVGDDATAALPSVMQLRGEITRELAQAPESRRAVLQPVLDRIDNLLADAGRSTGQTVNSVVGMPGDAAKGLPFAALRAVRTDLGRIIGGPPNAASAPSSDTAVYLRRLYGSLTDDMSAAARQAGPEAEQALSLADRYTRLNRTTNMPTLEKIIGIGTDEQIYRMLFPASGRPDAQVLARARRNMTRDEWNTTAATVLDRMGMPKPGVNNGEGFSVSSFLTHWNQLMDAGPAARQVLFGGTQDAALANRLDQLVRVAQRLRDVEKMANPSGTARNVIAAGGLMAAGGDAMQGDFGGAAATLGLTVLAPRYAAKLITNPEFVRWLAGAAPQVANGQVGEGTLRALLRIGIVNPELREAVDAYRITLPSKTQQLLPR